ncbi:hypothetical protein BDR26DRAFT_136976 [Obelidium mucronatum]|nr:hypothetical protein BDR26DRAFT_136976 [Obelidium mucronatum]
MIAASRAAKNLNATAKIAGDAKAAKAVITNMHIEIPRIKGEFKEEDALQLAKQLGEEQLRKRIIVMNEDGADEESSLHQQQQQQQQQQPSEETKSNNNDSTKGKSALILRLEKERAEEEERMRLLQEQQQQDHGYDSSEERYSSPHRKMTPAAAMALAEKRTAEYKRRTLENKKAQESRKRAGAKKIRYKDDFEEMSAMMSAVDEKIATIETNLSSILNSNIMQKHLPQSRKLINDVQAEYTRIEKMYRDSALAAIEASKAKVK